MPKKEETIDTTQEVTEATETVATDVTTSDDLLTKENVDKSPENQDAIVDENEEQEVKSISFSSIDENEIPVSSVDEHNPDEPITVQPVKFASFQNSEHSQGEINKNLDILMDIKLQMTVELGRTELPIKKVLELTRGSIIELEKIAGEPVELYANGKLVAHGEVVVIEDNFGLRITSITDPEDRLKGI